MIKTVFTDHELDVEIENTISDEYYAETIHVEYSLMDVPPDFSADNDQEFHGYKEVRTEDYFHDGNLFEDVADHVAGCLNMEVLQIIELLHQAVNVDAGL